jgi:hypothetical protein
VSFALDAKPRAPQGCQQLGKVALADGIELEGMQYAAAAAGEGRRVLYLGPTLNRLPRAGPGDTVEWGVRFVGAGGEELGAASMPAAPSASYFLEAPAGWVPGQGRVELMLRHRSTDAGSVGRVERLVRFALRFGTFRLLGNPEPRVREFGVGGKAPIVLAQW